MCCDEWKMTADKLKHVLNILFNFRDTTTLIYSNKSSLNALFLTIYILKANSCWICVTLGTSRFTWSPGTSRGLRSHWSWRSPWKTWPQRWTRLLGNYRPQRTSGNAFYCNRSVHNLISYRMWLHAVRLFHQFLHWLNAITLLLLKLAYLRNIFNSSASVY